jgi:hypothetical protein
MYNNKYTMRHSRRISIIAIMTSLALFGNYLLVALPNIELGSVILFFTAYIFGLHISVWCTLIMSIIFATINPWGGFIFPIWFAQTMGWLYMVSFGAIMGMKKPEQISSLDSSKSFAATGAYLTIFFDLVTNLGFAWASEIPYIIVLITGLPLMIVHVISNAMLFSLVVPRLHYIFNYHLASSIWNENPKQIDVLSEE